MEYKQSFSGNGKMKITMVEKSVVSSFQQKTKFKTPLVERLPDWASRPRFYNENLIPIKSNKPPYKKTIINEKGEEEVTIDESLITAEDINILKREIQKELEIRRQVWGGKPGSTFESFVNINVPPFKSSEIVAVASLNSLIDLADRVDAAGFTNEGNASVDKAVLRPKIGEIITAKKYNEIREKIIHFSSECICNCNYCACHCNYCSCQCNYSCTCQCNYNCTCHCNYWHGVVDYENWCYGHTSSYSCSVHSTFVPRD